MYVCFDMMQKHCTKVCAKNAPLITNGLNSKINIKKDQKIYKLKGNVKVIQRYPIKNTFKGIK